MNRFKRIFAIACGQHSVSISGKTALQGPHKFLLVIHDQNRCSPACLLISRFSLSNR